MDIETLERHYAAATKHVEDGVKLVNQLSDRLRDARASLDHAYNEKSVYGNRVGAYRDWEAEQRTYMAESPKNVDVQENSQEFSTKLPSDPISC